MQYSDVEITKNVQYLRCSTGYSWLSVSSGVDSACRAYPLRYTYRIVLHALYALLAVDEHCILYCVCTVYPSTCDAPDLFAVTIIYSSIIAASACEY